MNSFVITYKSMGDRKVSMSLKKAHPNMNVQIIEFPAHLLGSHTKKFSFLQKLFTSQVSLE